MTAGTIVAQLSSGAWCAGGASRYRVPFADSGEVGGLVAWALEYVEPLPTWLDQLAGDERAVRVFSDTWARAGEDLDGIAADIAASDRRLDDLDGKTARALRKRYDELRASVQDASDWTAASAAALALASEIVVAVREAVIGALSTLADLALDLVGFSLNPLDLNPLTALDRMERFVGHVQAFVDVIADLIDSMLAAVDELIALIAALQPLVEELLQRLKTVASKLAPAEGLLFGGPLGGILGGGLSDILAADPRVTELDPEVLDSKAKAAYDLAMGVDSLDSIDDLVLQNGYTDSMGKSVRSCVDMKLVRGVDGSQHWVISLPSTQDWNLLKGVMGEGHPWGDTFEEYGATNDLDSNVALMIMQIPTFRTQYERAVYQAMSDAGVQPGDDVVFTGFSQGGIMAANLAADTDSPYHVMGIVTNGAPIDSFDIPDTVKVLSIEHDGDVVPALDLHTYDASDALKTAEGTQQKYVMPNPHELDEDGNEYRLHSTGAYKASAQALLDAHPELNDTYAEFFGEVIDHQVHTWSE